VTDDLSPYGLGALPDPPDERDYPLSALYAATGCAGYGCHRHPGHVAPGPGKPRIRGGWDDPPGAQWGPSLPRRDRPLGAPRRLPRACEQDRRVGNGRGERDSPATNDLPITMRLAEPPEPMDWLKSA
jgi:hypothetical protein